jgi:N-acetylmuramoyl-L-alanine amidase
MTAPRITRWTTRVLATVLVGGVILGMLPPAFGREVPPSVTRTVRLSLPDLVPDGATADRTASGVRLRERAWTRRAEACAPVRFTMVGFTWRHEGDEPVQARLAWGAPGSFGSPVRLVADPDEGPDPGSPDASGIVGTPLQWTGEAECVRYRLRLEEDNRYDDLRAVFINTSGTATDPSPLAVMGSALARLWGIGRPEPAEAMAAKPAIITRKGWGANESWRSKYCDGEPDYAPKLKMAYVHHTAGSNTYSKAQADDVVRGVYSYHVNSLHYCDIAYNFLVDRFGRIYEGRYGGMTKAVIGGHAMGFNTGSTGVAAMGDFSTVVPPRPVRKAYKRLLAWRLDVAHQPPTGFTTMTSGGGSNQKFDKGQKVRLRVISGHRDTGYTACPGAELYSRLDPIRQGASSRGGPKIWSPRQTKQEISPGQRVRWIADLSKNLDWTIRVTDAQGVQVREFTGTGGQIDRGWRGKTKLGAPVPPGTYTVSMEARASTTSVARPAKFTLKIS